MKEAVNEITDGFEVIDVGFVERPLLDAEPDQIVFWKGIKRCLLCNLVIRRFLFLCC